jgi:hypothetical protein
MEHLRARLAGREETGVLSGAAHRRGTNWSWGGSWSGMRSGRVLSVPWEYLEGTAGWWASTPNRIRCLRRRCGLGRAKRPQREPDGLTHLERTFQGVEESVHFGLSPRAEGAQFLDGLRPPGQAIALGENAAANAFLKDEYWSQWNQSFAPPIQEFANQHQLERPRFSVLSSNE